MISKQMLLYSAILLSGVFISAVSQVMLKKAALREYDSRIKEYLNPLVISAYTLFFGTTLLSIIAYRVIPLSIGPILESTSYIYITIFGALLFNEKPTKRKLTALFFILLGIAVYTLLG